MAALAIGLAACSDQRPPQSPTASDQARPSSTSTSPATGTPEPSSSSAGPVPLGWVRAGRLPTPGSAIGLVSFGDGYVAYGGRPDDAGPAAWFSPDGRGWRAADLGQDPVCLGSGPAITAAAAAPSQVLLVGEEPRAAGGSCTWHLVTWTSTDGMTWQRRAVPEIDGFSVRALAWLGGRYEAWIADERGVTSVWTSPDGASWTRAAEIDFVGELETVTALAGASDGTRLVAVVMGDVDPTQTILRTSSDGVTWDAPVQPPVDEGAVSTIVPPGPARPAWLVTTIDPDGEVATIWTSPDLAHWTSGPFPYPAIGPIVATSSGLLTTGRERCMDTGTECEVQPPDYFVSDDGLVWRPLHAREAAETYVDGPAGIVGFAASGIDAWRLEPYTADEARLLAGLREDARPWCAPRREDLPPKAVAGVSCSPGTNGVDEIGVYRFTNAADLQATYLERIADAGLRRGTGDCPRSPGEMAYVPEAPGTVGPHRIACFRNEFGNANLRFTVPDALTYVGILGSGRDLARPWDWAWTGNQDQPGAPTVWRDPGG